MAALLPAAMQLVLLRRGGMLGRWQVAALLAAAAAGMGLDGLGWVALFGR